jgi:carbonic anhydrase
LFPPTDATGDRQAAALPRGTRMNDRSRGTQMTAPAAPAPQLARALAENDRYAAQFDRSSLPLPPGRKLAVLACMDARLTVEDALGLRTGDAHIIRNAGGLATDDAIRSLVISQHLLGTEEVIVVEHTGCGMLTFEDERVREQITSATGETVDLPLRPFDDLEENLRAQVERIRSHPWVKDVPVSGLVYEVESGRLHQIA